MKILIIEDDFVSRRLLKFMLSPYGRCYFATNGVEGLEEFKESFLEKKPYDLVLIDIMMPEKNGQDTLKEIREFEVENGVVGLDVIKIIMVTALRDVKNIKTAFSSQCEAYLTKPVDREKLIKTLEELELINTSEKEVENK